MAFCPRSEWSKLKVHLPEDFTVFLAESEKVTDEFSSEEPIESFPTEDLEMISEQGENLSKEELTEIALKASEEQTAYFINEFNDKVYANESYNDEEHLELFENVEIKPVSYDKIGQHLNTLGTNKHVVLIIGGETGLSCQAKKFALENEGLKISIPLENNVESLNNSVATGIITYEIIKHLKTLNNNNEPL